ncbi:uncharacterized protein GIQ15_05798 [Arthroderma uncinatum]|uniref:uncharacterized protein n=1 Tax=Arthroderma uncinatum TaxID=74035 RepID=UPI00144AD2F0|nr:uncharacterized protein GIQ15_05798 [Arthroderma uncinatum]KAF3480451.1 hypothetical protein GIQ15_05798 [Arthroderma uncinatum]
MAPYPHPPMSPSSTTPSHPAHTLSTHTLHLPLSTMALDPRPPATPSVAALRPNPYKHHPTPVWTRSPPVIFDRQKTILPRELSLTVPEDVLQTFNIVRQKADAALKGFLFLEQRYRYRYYYLCPLKPLQRIRKHINSIDRLLNWSTNRNEFTSVSAKIPACVISFKVDEAAYAEFTASFNKFREGYLRGPYRTWLNADSYFGAYIDDANMPMYTRRMLIEWWNGFRGEMRVWEEKAHSLTLPSWQSIIAELAGIIEERIDLQREWDIWL